MSKCYVLVFKCAKTRAIHLEYSLSIPALKNELKLFYSSKTSLSWKFPDFQIYWNRSIFKNFWDNMKTFIWIKSMMGRVLQTFKPDNRTFITKGHKNDKLTPWWIKHYFLWRLKVCLIVDHLPTYQKKTMI